MHNPAIEDAELVERARGGDLDAYGELVRRHQDQALATAFMILGDRHEAEDAAQEAFTRAYLALRSFRPGASFRAWLLRIVVNEAHDLYAARQRRADVLARASGQVGSPTASQSAEAAALARQRRELLLTALFRLPAVDRLVITCRYFLDLPEAETADVLGVARGTVKSRLSRALARLAPILRQLGPLVLVGPLLGEGLDVVLHELGRVALVQPSADLSGSVLAQIGETSVAGSGAGHLLASLRQHVGAAILGLATLAVGGGVLAGSMAPRAAPLATATAVPSVAAAPAPMPAPAVTTAPAPRVGAMPTPASPPRPVLVVYGGDTTDADRQALVAYFGPTPPGASRVVSRHELVRTLQTQGWPVAPTDQAISSVRLECGAAGSGLDIQTRNITLIPAAAYAGALLVAGLEDASVMVAAPPDKPVTGETALVAILDAYPVCAAGWQPDPERERLAFRQLELTAQLAANGSDLTHASAVMLQALHAVITGGAQDQQSAEAVLEDAAAQRGVTLDDTTRTQLAELLQQLRTVQYGAYASGYNIQQLGPDEAHVTITH